MNSNAQRMAQHSINCGETGNTRRAAEHTLDTASHGERNIMKPVDFSDLEEKVLRHALAAEHGTGRLKTAYRPGMYAPYGKLNRSNTMTVKKHYIYRARRWFEFQSLAAAREFLRTAKDPDTYRSDLQPREWQQKRPTGKDWGFVA